MDSRQNSSKKNPERKLGDTHRGNLGGIAETVTYFLGLCKGISKGITARIPR